MSLFVRLSCLSNLGLSINSDYLAYASVEPNTKTWLLFQLKVLILQTRSLSKSIFGTTFTMYLRVKLPIPTTFPLGFRLQPLFRVTTTDINFPTNTITHSPETPGVPRRVGVHLLVLPSYDLFHRFRRRRSPSSSDVSLSKPQTTIPQHHQHQVSEPRCDPS